MRKRMLTLFASAVTAYFLLGALLYGCQRSLLFHPDQTIPSPAEYGFKNLEARRLITSDGFNILAWWRAPEHPDAQVIVYFHGNAGHLGHRAEKIRPYLLSGYGLLLISYRYNAEAGGEPSENGLYEDGRTAFRFLKEAGISGDRVVAYGESLGTAVAVTMATEHDVAAVVLEAPYTSIADVAQSHYWYMPSGWLLKDKFDIRDKITAIDAPLLVVHGERDQIIPVRFGKKLLKLAEEPKEGVFLPAAGHNDIHDHRGSIEVLKFLENVLGQPNR